jgi:hypothetical protein
VRIGNLWDRLISFPSLLRAARKARKGKRSGFDVRVFELEAEWVGTRCPRLSPSRFP